MGEVSIREVGDTVEGRGEGGSGWGGGAGGSGRGGGGGGPRWGRVAEASGSEGYRGGGVGGSRGQGDGRRVEASGVAVGGEGGGGVVVASTLFSYFGSLNQLEQEIGGDYKPQFEGGSVDLNIYLNEVPIGYQGGLFATGGTPTFVLGGHM
ncbi:uncharacterized protein LOC130975144 [Arachis stenosperma]|uniref:uncharacterized protein LOC130975144 n=1 Tax=Arachis stenosperma TaxID=217475 RepID=UPI0025AC5484|nr:uncharacterized protein LOC130975144 [Arachis stenosperma]